jgi:hypothetical protein
VGQWLPFKVHYYSYYILPTAIFFLAIALQTANLLALRISRRSKFDDFTVEGSDAGAEVDGEHADHALPSSRDDRAHEDELSRHPALSHRVVPRSGLFLQEANGL